jgi:hypothetical protein
VEAVSFIGGAMRARLVATAAAVAVGLVAASVAPGEAFARQDGIIVVQQTLTLNFPAPGLYKGEVDLKKPKLKRNAKRGRRHAPKADRSFAKFAARKFCRNNIWDTPVRVLHLSKPPFPIGADTPTVLQSYSVAGAQPPTGELVKAFQLGASKRSWVGKSPNRYRWRIRCKGAQVTKPYPF